MEGLCMGHHAVPSIQLVCGKVQFTNAHTHTHHLTQSTHLMVECEIVLILF